MGTYLFRSILPRPYADVVICDLPVQHVLRECIFCGLGFALEWAVKLANCCHPQYEWCSCLHFESSKFCITVDCGVEMYEGWWISIGLLKPGISIPLKSTIKQFLVEHPNVNLHFTPTYSSWLNQVESWFSKLQREVIDRGIFTSVADLKRKILRYIRLYQKTAKPFKWKYSDVRKRIAK